MKATHRAITAHTMAEVLEGRYNHKIRSVRIIDCRYFLLKITFVRINANMFKCSIVHLQGTNLNLTEAIYEGLRTGNMERYTIHLQAEKEHFQ